ncbi:hypothetical protein EJ110_NYTH06813 [Nymphaea thermarum]|nr:hypothetical protein EJ110_NYTH06813 [Nymphaea thermarum]
MTVAFVTVLSILVVAMLAVPGGLNSGRVMAGDSQKGKDDLKAVCGKYVLNHNPLPGPPSPSCCNKVMASDIPGVCRALTPADLKIYNITLALCVDRKCGYPLPAGFKCAACLKLVDGEGASFMNDVGARSCVE